jgi:hypothetical protein
MHWAKFLETTAAVVEKGIVSRVWPIRKLSQVHQSESSFILLSLVSETRTPPPGPRFVSIPDTISPRLTFVFRYWQPIVSHRSDHFARYRALHCCSWLRMISIRGKPLALLEASVEYTSYRLHIHSTTKSYGHPRARTLHLQFGA